MGICSHWLGGACCFEPADTRWQEGRQQSICSWPMRRSLACSLCSQPTASPNSVAQIHTLTYTLLDAVMRSKELETSIIVPLCLIISLLALYGPLSEGLTCGVQMLCTHVWCADAFRSKHGINMAAQYDVMTNRMLSPQMQQCADQRPFLAEVVAPS